MNLRALIVALAGLSACTQFPELDETATPGVAQAPYPRIVPLDGLLSAPAPVRATPEVIDEVTARASGLEARAEALQGRATAQPDSVAERLRWLRARAEALRAE
ncbi:hypothetical protein [Sagittula salina]|uniref:Uncharacterized protein n=1 Tax=Sagittula salina TaxID=2820268 RepID=A0A940S415_9RHOB|nr:hypothetical protein [Sagittula salina]MBP0483395.1 hypothetical protein [Sagittula salina]